MWSSILDVQVRHANLLLKYKLHFINLCFSIYDIYFVHFLVFENTQNEFLSKHFLGLSFISEKISPLDAELVNF